ncbi:MAG: hypothetical protein RL695_594 [Pseudomonadota bacterium]
MKNDGSFKLRALALACALLGTQASWANEGSDFSFSGFGTLSAVHSDDRDSDYRGSIVHPNGAGKSQAISTGVDSKFGVQIAKNFGNGLSGIVQAVADHRADNTYAPLLEWANLKYDIGSNAYVRGGRVVAPVFMISDYRNVGYAQTPIRQPYDVYALNPITHLDGLDAGARFNVGDGVLSTSLAIGESKDLSNRYIVRGKTRMINLSYEQGASMFRAMINRSTFDFIPYDTIVAGTTARIDAYKKSAALLAGIPAAGYPTANLQFEDAKAKFWALGYTYDPGTWLLQAEYASRKLPSLVIQDAVAWYVLGGYRVGKFTPFASYSRVDSREPAAKPAAVAASSALATPVMVVNLTDAISKPLIDQNTISLGVRYDLMRSVALKAQFDHISKPGSLSAPSNGHFTNVATGSSWQTNKQSVNILSASIDFVF